MRRRRYNIESNFISFVDMLFGAIGIICLITILIAIVAEKIEQGEAKTEYKLPYYEPDNQIHYFIYYYDNYIMFYKEDKFIKQVSTANENYDGLVDILLEISEENNKQIQKASKKTIKLYEIAYPGGLENYHDSYYAVKDLDLNIESGTYLLNEGETFNFNEKN